MEAKVEGVMLRGAYRYDLWYDNAHTHAFVCGLNQSVLVVTSTTTSTFLAHVYVLFSWCKQDYFPGTYWAPVVYPLLRSDLTEAMVISAGE